ncbi:MAG: VOC family protein [Promethearchaeota archaeon]
MEPEAQRRESAKFAVNHLGVVVRDVERAAREYERLFGIGPFNVVLRDVDQIELRGKPSTVRLKSGLAFAGGVQIELVEVVEGRSVHSEFLEAGNEGLHHLGVFVEDLDAELEKYAAAGCDVLSRGTAYGVARWAYVDTKDLLGFVFELVEKPPPRTRRRGKDRRRGA